MFFHGRADLTYDCNTYTNWWFSFSTYRIPTWSSYTKTFSEIYIKPASHQHLLVKNVFLKKCSSKKLKILYNLMYLTWLYTPDVENTYGMRNTYNYVCKLPIKSAQYESNKERLEMQTPISSGLESMTASHRSVASRDGSWVIARLSII